MIDQERRIPVRIQTLYEDVDGSFGHNPRENKFLKVDGVYYGFATRPRRFPPSSDKEAYNKAIHTFPTGLFAFRRSATGVWEKISDTPSPWCSSALVGPDGRFWMEGTRDWDRFDLYRMRTPMDFTSFDRVYEGKGSCYGGVSVSPEGHVLAMHAANNNHNADTDNSVISAFYDAQTDQWHYNGWATPDGRNGYHRMLVNGRSALGVCQRAVYETTSSYARWNVLATWRKVTLFACDDLTSRPWRIRRYWLEPPFGATMIWDLFRGPDGAAYVAYDYVTAETFEDSHQPCTLHIARIHEDLSAECFDLGVPGDGGRPCPVFDRRGNWYLTYWDTTDQINYLLKLDPENGFRVTARYTLGDADTPMVLHTLRPEQFGGENDVSDTVRYVSRGYRPQGGDAYPLMDMIYGEFELPVEEAE